MAWKIWGLSGHRRTAELSYPLKKEWPTSRLSAETFPVIVTPKPQLGIFWMEHVPSQPCQEAFLQVSRKPLFGTVSSLDLRYCSLVSSPVSGITSFLLLCGVPGGGSSAAVALAGNGLHYCRRVLVWWDWDFRWGHHLCWGHPWFVACPHGWSNPVLAAAWHLMSVSTWLLWNWIKSMNWEWSWSDELVLLKNKPSQKRNLGFITSL